MSGYVNPEAAAGRARAQQFNEALGAGAREIIPGLVEVEDIVPVGPGYRFPDHIAGFTAFGLDMKNKSYPTESSSAHYGSTSLRLICQAADEGKTTGAVAYVVWAVVMWLRKRGLYICIDDYGRINNPTHHLEELTRLLRRKRRAGDADAIFRADDGTPLLAKTVAMINRLLLHRDKLYVQHMLGRLVLGICGSNDDADGHAILFATDKKRTGKAQEVVKEHRLKVNGSYMMAKSLGCGDLLHGVLPQARVASWSAVFGYTDDPSKETPWIAERERLVWGPLR